MPLVRPLRPPPGCGCRAMLTGSRRRSRKMQKPFDASFTRKSCHAFGCIDVHRLERVSTALYVKADSVYHGECTADGCDDRLILIDMAMDREHVRVGLRERHEGSGRVWRGEGVGEA